jgi:hypothetical protein
MAETARDSGLDDALDEEVGRQSERRTVARAPQTAEDIGAVEVFWVKATVTSSSSCGVNRIRGVAGAGEPRAPMVQKRWWAHGHAASPVTSKAR